MLATLITSGSGAASTQTACGRRVRTMRSETIRCSRRFLSLCRSCSPRWSSTAGSELRRVEPASATVETLAPERRTSSSGLAPMKAASGVPQQKQKQEENCSRIAPKSGGRVVGRRRGDEHLAGEDDLAHLPRVDPLASASPTIASKSPGGRALRISAWALGWGSSIGSGLAPQPRQARRRAGRQPPLDVVAGRDEGVDREEGAPARCGRSRAAGRVSEAGGSEDQGGVEAPCGSKAKPPAQTGPAPAGRPGRLLDERVAADRRGTRRRRRRSAAGRARSPGGRCRAPPGRSRGRAAPSRTSDPRRAARRRRPRRGRRRRPGR